MKQPPFHFPGQPHPRTSYALLTTSHYFPHDLLPQDNLLNSMYQLWYLGALDNAGALRCEAERRLLLTPYSLLLLLVVNRCAIVERRGVALLRRLHKKMEAEHKRHLDFEQVVGGGSRW